MQARDIVGLAGVLALRAGSAGASSQRGSREPRGEQSRAVRERPARARPVARCPEIHGRHPRRAKLSFLWAVQVKGNKEEEDFQNTHNPYPSCRRFQIAASAPAQVNVAVPAAGAALILPAPAAA